VCVYGSSIKGVSVFNIVLASAFVLAPEPFTFIKVDPPKKVYQPWRDYNGIKAQALLTGQPVVVYANCEPRIIAGAISCRDDSWSEESAIFVSRQVGNTIKFFKLPHDAPYSEILKKMEGLPQASRAGRGIEVARAAPQYRSSARACST
jgi:hypothetical protein